MAGGHEVFISYARRASRTAAVALHDALAEVGVSVFLDTDAIEDGAQFPEALSAAVLRARVGVVFADHAYFQRPYCLRELTLLRPPRHAAGCAGRGVGRHRRGVARRSGAAGGCRPVAAAADDEELAARR